MTGQESTYLCSKCARVFNKKFNCLRHEQICSPPEVHKDNQKQATDQTICKKCRKSFTSYKYRMFHEKNVCGKTSTPKNKQTVQATENKNANDFNKDNADVSIENKVLTPKKPPIKPKCRTCNTICDSFKDLYAHRIEKHVKTNQVNNSLQNDPWTENNLVPPWDVDQTDDNQNLRKTYDQHKHLILKQRKTVGKIKTSYNFPVPDEVSINQMMTHVEQIFRDSHFCFKLNISLGIILQHIETGAYRYFVPYHNDTLFSVPMYVRNRGDLDRIRTRLSQLDVIEYAKKQRPNTKWKPILLTNVVYEIYNTSYPLGFGQSLPRYIVNMKSIISFERDPNTKRIYQDNKCFFRCLAYHKSKKVKCALLTKALHKQWLKYAKSRHISSSQITIDRIPDLEECFHVNINVYSLQENRIVKSVFKSRELYKTTKDKPDTMNLNLFEDHLSYITRFHSFAKKVACLMCDRLFSRLFHLNRHYKICDKTSKLKFPGGFYSSPKNIFEKLSEIGIKVDQSLQIYPWIIVYDMEALLLNNKSKNSMWKTEHRPISVCLASNVPGFEAIKFILEPNEEKLVEQMVDYMNLISDKAYELSQLRWKCVFDAFDNLEKKWMIDVTERSSHDNEEIGDSCVESNITEPPSKEFVHALSKENVYHDFLKRLHTTGELEAKYNDWTDIQETSNEQDASNDRDTDDDDDDDDDDEQAADITTKRLMLKLLKQYKKEFEIYCRRTVCIGFNSGKYDTNLIRTNLAGHLNLDKSGHNFVIKRNNNYNCIANEKLKLLDMSNYLPPGTSYDKFLETFNIEQRKSYFPYEYLSDISVLEETSLPPAEAFYSSLKQQNVLESDVFVRYCILVEEENKSIEEALLILKLEKPPVSQVDENYKCLLQIWKDENMHTMADYLKYYNSLDVGPMLKAVEAYKQFFITQKIDVFKDCISVPGVARKMLFQCGTESGGSFSLFNRRDEDLYHKMKASLSGGPSVVVTRYHEVGKTFIRDDESMPCKSIVGYDFNSLYLFCLGNDMPSGYYIRRKKENDFRPENDITRYNAMYDWMEWLNSTQNANIKHKMNQGNELRIGPYFVDGYNPNTRDIYEFLGCFFHGHSCVTWKNKITQKERYDKTVNRIGFLEQKGYTIHRIWQCEFQKQINESEQLRQFIKDRRPTFYQKHPQSCKTSDILDSVVKNELFGFLEVDIQIPDTWDEVNYKPNTDLSPRDYFDEMAPIFCTSEISFESIGEHMTKHARKQNLSKAPRSLLVGGLRAKKIILFSPLLKWYIEQGLLVTAVYEVQVV